MDTEPDVAAPTAADPVADPPGPAASPGQGGEAGRRPAAPARAPEPRRRKLSAIERRYAGFGDEFDRACCAAFAKAVPPDFPVQLRAGVATLRIKVVARRPGAILFCDGAHPGPHLWPLGDPVLEDEVEPGS